MKKPSLKHLIFLTIFSLLFLVFGAMMVPFFGCAVLMGFLQGIIAFSLGMVGRMGALSMIGYIFPGIVIDCVIAVAKKIHLNDRITAFAANALASVTAGLVANIIVLRLKGVALIIYLGIAFISGTICGYLSGILYKWLHQVIVM